MTSHSPLVLTTPGDIKRAADLRRIKLVASLVLASSLALFAISKWLLSVHPVFGFIAAFAEAATIGGLADWYAIVALFRRPLGLPIPHTAIIPSNQDRIADKLGAFIESHFLDTAPVEAKLREVDFGGFIADWLRDRKRSADLSTFVLRLLPEAMSATESSGLTAFLSRRITSQLQTLDLAPLAAGTLRALVEQGRHKGLLDDLLRIVHQSLTEPDTLAILRERIRAELPTLLKLYRADKFVLNKIVASAGAFFEEVRNDPNHPFRGEFDRMLLTFVGRLGNDPALTGWIGDLKRDLLARPELADLIRNIWRNAQSFIARSASGESQVLGHHLTGMFVKTGELLATDHALRGEINEGMVTVLGRFIAEQKSGVSGFISSQVKSWNMGQLISLIELNIGPDLQYIRFNGSLIGGLAGLALYTAEYLLRLL